MPLSWVLKPLAVASAVAFSTLGLLSTRYQKARFYWNSVLFLATLGWASVCGLCITFYSAAAGNVSGKQISGPGPRYPTLTCFSV